MVGQTWHLNLLLAETSERALPSPHCSWETTTLLESQPIRSFGIVAAEACQRLRIASQVRSTSTPRTDSFPLGNIKHAELCSAVLWISSLKLKPCEAEVDKSHRGTENGVTSMGQLPTPYVIILRNCTFPYKAVLGLVNLSVEELPIKLNTGYS